MFFTGRNFKITHPQLIFVIIGIVMVEIVWFTTHSQNFTKLSQKISQTDQILLTGQGFSPSELTVAQGTTVTFSTNTGKAFWPASDLHPSHLIYPEFDPKIPIQPDKSWVFKFDKVGIWNFHDHLSPGFRGKIIVTGRSTSQSAQEIPNILPPAQTIPQNLQQLATQIINTCQTSSYHPACYDQEIPKLMDQGTSMEEAFQVTKAVQSQDPTYSYCHVLGHNLSAKEVQKDPTQWKEVVSRCPSGMCSNGCIHGGFQEKFRAEYLTPNQVDQIKPDLMTICEDRASWHPTGLEQASCYHALGHLTMYITQANLNKSVSLCDEISVKSDGRDFRQLCYDGVFMQIYQPLEPEDFALVKGKQPTSDQVTNFCSQYSKLPKASCLSESWPLFRESLLQRPISLIEFCSKEELSGQARCYEGLFYVLTAQFNFDTTRIKNYCQALPEKTNTGVDIQSQCFANAASRMIETDYRNIDKSIELCAQSQKNQQSCFNELVYFSTYNFHQGSQEFFHLCQSLPDPWKTTCLSSN